MTTFATLGLDPALVDSLEAQGLTEPFPIQAAAIPDALAGRDVLGRGPTGSGKTLAFGLPILQRLAGVKPAAYRPGGLVLAPTRELAVQIAERLEPRGRAVGVGVAAVVGGVPVARHERLLTKPLGLLVATPGRAQDLVDRGALDLAGVAISALDEADQMADMGFLPQVRRLLRATPKGGQRLLFSATLDGEVSRLVDEFLDEPAEHSTAPVAASVETMEHFRLLVGDGKNRNAVATWIAARRGTTIMFVRTKRGVDRLVKKLRRAGINAAGLHGDKAQGARQRALDGFADGSVPVLVATDIAARGIDVSGVDLVCHVDPPVEHKTYLHRAGRTARAGSAGRVVTLVTEDREDEVAKLLKKAGVDAPAERVEPGDERLSELTGARKPSGEALAPFGAPQPGGKGPARGPKGQPGQKKGAPAPGPGSGSRGRRRGPRRRGGRPRR